VTVGMSEMVAPAGRACGSCVSLLTLGAAGHPGGESLGSTINAGQPCKRARGLGMESRLRHGASAREDGSADI
jgi:hypothetical protein